MCGTRSEPGDDERCGEKRGDRGGCCLRAGLACWPGQTSLQGRRVSRALQEAGSVPGGSCSKCHGPEAGMCPRVQGKARRRVGPEVPGREWGKRTWALGHCGDTGFEIGAWGLRPEEGHTSHTVANHCGLRLLGTNCKAPGGKRHRMGKDCRCPGERQERLTPESRPGWLAG